MTTRTIKIIGQGYGSTPVAVTATVNGSTVFNGNVPTVNEDIRVTDDAGPGLTLIQNELLSNQTTLFSFGLDVGFSGNVSVSFDVSGGSVYLGPLMSNYILSGTIPNPAATPEQIAIVENPVSTQSDIKNVQIALANPPMTTDEQVAFLSADLTVSPWPAFMKEHNCYLTALLGATGYEQIPCNSDGGGWSNVMIDGLLNDINPELFTPPKSGQWWFVVHDGSTFTANLNISAGIE